MNIPAGVKSCILNYCRRTAVNPGGSRLKDPIQTVKKIKKKILPAGDYRQSVLWIAVTRSCMDDIRGMGLKPRDPGGAGRSLSCASSRLLQFLSANLLPACGPVVYGWCCVFPPVHDAVHDRRSFPVYGCSSLSWYFLPDYSQGKNQYFLRPVLDWRQSFFRFPVMISRAGGSNGKSVPGISSPRACHGYPVTSVWLSRVLPQDPHSDQEVRSCSTYIHQISRVWSSYLAVQRLNRFDGKDINEPGIL